MLKLTTYFLVGLVLFLTACNKGQEEKVTSKGMKYTIVDSKDGRQPRVGEWVILHFTLKDDKDSVLRSTYKDGLPAWQLIQDTALVGNKNSFVEMISALHLGDSVHIKLDTEGFFKHVIGGKMPERADTINVFYALKVADILSTEEFDKFRIEQVSKRDDKEINDFVTRNNIKAEKDTTGLQYLVYNQTGKQKPTVNDCVEIKYRGRFFQNGRVFESNVITMPLGDMIDGWKVGIPKLGEGDSATLFIPSRLGYGTRGQGRIPPDAILVFDVTLLGVKKYDATTGECK